MRASCLVLGLSVVLASTRVLAADAAPVAPATAAPATAAPVTPPPAGAATPAPAPAAPAPSPEAVAEAGRQTELARQALKARRFAQAAQLFESAGLLGKQSSAHVQAGLAWEQAERPERAADAFARALAGEAPDATAKEHLDALERSLGTVEVKAPAGYTVQLDSGTEALAPARLHGVAGIHSLAIAAPDRPIARRDVRLELGKPLALTLKDEPATAGGGGGSTENHHKDAAPTSGGSDRQPQRAPAAERPPPGQLRRAVGFTAIGLGAASLGATILLGLETINARNAFNEAPTKTLYDHEQTLQTWTNVALVSGAVLAVGGVVLVLWPASSSGSGEVTVGVAPGLGGGSVVGSF